MQWDRWPQSRRDVLVQGDAAAPSACADGVRSARMRGDSSVALPAGKAAASVAETLLLLAVSSASWTIAVAATVVGAKAPQDRAPVPMDGLASIAAARRGARSGGGAASVPARPVASPLPASPVQPASAVAATWSAVVPSAGRGSVSASQRLRREVRANQACVATLAKHACVVNPALAAVAAVVLAKTAKLPGCA